MTEFSIFELGTGRFVASMDMPNVDQLRLNYDAATQEAILGDFDERYYCNDGVVEVRPSIPIPTVSARSLDFATPPQGLHVSVYDSEFGGYLMGTGEVSGENARVVIPGPGLFRFCFAASFPFLPLEIEQRFV